MFTHHFTIMNTFTQDSHILCTMNCKNYQINEVSFIKIQFCQNTRQIYVTTSLLVNNRYTEKWISIINLYDNLWCTCLLLQKYVKIFTPYFFLYVLFNFHCCNLDE